jgi:hypothetical protein
VLGAHEGAAEPAGLVGAGSQVGTRRKHSNGRSNISGGRRASAAR